MGEARGIAQEIASDLDKLTPKPGERMSPEQKRGRSRACPSGRRAWPSGPRSWREEAGKQRRQGAAASTGPSRS